MDYLYEYANSLTPISKTSYEEIKTFLKEKTFKPKTILCNTKDIPKYGYFIKKGIIRGYVLNENGKEYTKSLFSDFQFAGPLSALIERRPSNLIYETLTECEVIEADYYSIKELNNRRTDLMIFSLRMLERYYVGLENKIIDLGTKAAKERYLNLKEKFQNIENLIPQYHIASILGITPIQLSRIRKDIYSS